VNGFTFTAVYVLYDLDYNILAYINGTDIFNTDLTIYAANGSVVATLTN